MPKKVKVVKRDETMRTDDDVEGIEGMMQELDYYPIETVQHQVRNESEVMLIPLATVQQGAPIEFVFNTSDNLCLDLHDTYLETNVKITKSDGTNLGAAAEAVACNNIFDSMWSNVDILLNGKAVTVTNQLYPYVAYLKAFLYDTKESMETRLQNQGWYRDTAGRFASTDPQDATAATLNEGLKKRGVDYNTSAVKNLVGRLRCDLFEQQRCIPPGVEFKLRLRPNANDVILMSAVPGGGNPQNQYKLDILDIKLWVHVQELSPEAVLSLTIASKRANLRIPYTKFNARYISISRGHTSNSSDIIQGPIPDRVFLAMVRDTAMTGNYQQNPFYFQNFDISHLQLSYGGEGFPRLPLEFTWANKKYGKGYNELLKAINMNSGSSCLALTPVEWANGFTIFGFKLLPGKVDVAKPPPRRSTVRCDIRFNTALAENINLIVIWTHPEVIEIDQDKNIIIK